MDTKGGGSEGFVSVATKFTCFHFWIFPLNALKLLQNKRLCQFCCCAQHSCKKWGLINWIAPFIFIIENILKPLLAKFWYLIEFEITIRLLNNFSRNLASSKFLKNPPKRSKLCLPHSRHPTLACNPPEQEKMNLRLLSSWIQYPTRSLFHLSRIEQEFCYFNLLFWDENKNFGFMPLALRQEFFT